VGAPASEFGWSPFCSRPRSTTPAAGPRGHISREPVQALAHYCRLMRPVSRQQALEAVRAFHAKHGRLPRWREWERATALWPCAKTIERRWGWRELLAEAIGVRPNDIDVSWEAVLNDRAEAMLAGLRLARDELVSCSGSPFAKDGEARCERGSFHEQRPRHLLAEAGLGSQNGA